MRSRRKAGRRAGSKPACDASPSWRQSACLWTSARAMAYGIPVNPVSIGASLTCFGRADRRVRGRRLLGLLRMIRRGRHERAGFELYGAAVAAARDPFLYLAM